MSGPGAEAGDERARALPISSAASAGQSLNGSRTELKDPTGSPGKKWLRRALLSSAGVVASGSSGNRGGGRPTANFFAVHTICCVAVAKNADQWSLLAFLIALKYAVLAALADARSAASNLSVFKEWRAEL